jgi:hypothetical protein
MQKSKQKKSERGSIEAYYVKPDTKAKLYEIKAKAKMNYSKAIARGVELVYKELGEQHLL